ncbi:MAG: tripartite tricarboxylate transporter TctB family protein [Burkholderiales bacterium]
MKINDALSGAGLLALSGWVFWEIRSFPNIPGQNIGPGAFPGLLAALLAGCAVPLIVRGLRERAAGGAWFVPGAWMTSGPHLRAFLIAIGCLLFYILLSDRLGFILCGSLLLMVLFATLKVRPALIVPIALGVTLLIHTIFYKGLRVPLPWGVLLPVAW